MNNRLLETSTQVLCALINSVTFSPTINDDDVREDENGHLIKQGDTYVQMPPKKKGSKLIIPSGKKYSVKDPMALYNKQAIAFSKKLIEACDNE